MKSAICVVVFAIGLMSSAALADECMINVTPDRDRGVLGDLVFYSFDPMLEVQIDTPTQPSDMSFMIALDGEETPDILAFPGLDDLVLSLVSPNGDLAVDMAFVSRLMASDELAVFGFRNSSIVTFASYDLTALRARLGECALG